MTIFTNRLTAIDPENPDRDVAAAAECVRALEVWRDMPPPKRKAGKTEAELDPWRLGRTGAA